MSFLTLLGLALGLAMDAFAVAIVTGIVLPRVTIRHYFRLSFHFGLFQFMMPIIGWFVGSMVADRIAAIDHWVAFGLLVFIGGRMIRGSLTNDTSATQLTDPTRKGSLMLLSLATSIDALMVGLSLAMLEVEIWMPSVVIGVVAALMTALGLAAGRRLGCRFGRRMELLGGLVLIAIGVKILLSHLLT